MTTAPPVDLVDIFTPTSLAPSRDPYHGLGKEGWEAHEAEKKARRERMRDMMRRAKDPETENTALWCCTHCFTPFREGDVMWLTYGSYDFKYAAKCQTCYENFGGSDVAPFKRSGSVRVEGD